MSEKICAKSCWGHNCPRVCVLLEKNHGGLHVCGGHYRTHEGWMTKDRQLAALKREREYYRQRGRLNLIKLVDGNIEQIHDEEE